MNFPQVHGARIVLQPDPELAEAEARLAALDAEDLVPVRPEWIEATVAKVAGKPPRVHGGRLRRAAAAAVAFFALHGFATAATVTAVSAVAVTAVVLWPEGANSSETMSYELALRLLQRPDQREEHRAIAEIFVVGRVRAVIEALKSVRNEPGASVKVVAAAEEALDSMRAALRVASPGTWGESHDPVPVAVATMRSRDLDEESRISCVERSAAAACAGISGLVTMAEPTSRLATDRDIYLRRISGWLKR